MHARYVDQHGKYHVGSGAFVAAKVVVEDKTAPN
jgi:hypothetical protein